MVRLEAISKFLKKHKLCMKKEFDSKVSFFVSKCLWLIYLEMSLVILFT